MLINEGYKVIVLVPDLEKKNEIESIGAEVILIKMDLSGTNPILDLFTILNYLYILFKKPGLVLSFTPKANIYSGIAACFKYFWNRQAIRSKKFN